MTKLEQDIFFSILRSAIWQKPLDMEIPEDVDFENLIQSYADHGLLAVVGSTLIKLSESKHIVSTVGKQILLSPNQKEDILDYCACMAQAHTIVDDAIVKVFTALEEAGCRPILLKGQGLSALYPEPYTRYVGDIDIYVGEYDFEKAYRVVEDTFGLEHREDIYMLPEPHGVPIFCSDIRFELHHHVCDAAVPIVNENINKYFNDIVNEGFLEHVMIQGKAINVLPFEYNIVYVFNHLCEHIRSQGCGFRQFVDIYMLLKYSRNVDKKFLEGILEKFYLLKAWKYITKILYEVLGELDHDELSISLKKDSYNSLLLMVLDGGDFGYKTYSKVFKHRFVKYNIFYKYFLLFQYIIRFARIDYCLFGVHTVTYIVHKIIRHYNYIKNGLNNVILIVAMI